MNRLIAVLALGVAIALAPGHAAEEKPPARYKIKVREGVPNPETGLDPTKPATLAFTNPDGEKNHYKADLGVSLWIPQALAGGALLEHSFTSELHRNDSLKDYNHSLIQSYSAAGVWGSVKDDPLILGFAGKLGYKDDRKEGTRSGLGSLEGTLTSGGIGNANGILNRGPLRLLNSAQALPFKVGGQTLVLRPYWSAGVEFERISKSSKGRPLGHAWRGIVRYQWELEFDKAPLDRLALSYGWNFWHDLAESASRKPGVDSRRLYIGKAVWWFDAAKVWGLELRRTDGEDPAQGKPDQHFTSIAITFKWDYDGN